MFYLIKHTTVHTDILYYILYLLSEVTENYIYYNSLYFRLILGS